MKISLDWLSDYIDLSPMEPSQIAARLTDIGHTVESIDQHGEDTVLDIEFTANRIDAMSHRGLARELSTAFSREMKATEEKEPASAAGQPVNVSIDAPDLCSRYTALVVHGVRIEPSSAKIRRRLEAVGIRPVNNVVDVTNYVMYAVGHPLHAFDLSLLEGCEIRVRRGAPGEKMTSLDGQVRQLTSEMVVIGDATRAVALGGVIGAANSEIRETTKDILLECAHFSPSSIRKTGRRLGIRTDAAYRFERGVDPDDTVFAIEMAASLILEEAGGSRGSFTDIVAKPSVETSVLLRQKRLSQLSAGGADLTDAVEIFGRLGFGVESSEDGLNVTVPARRGDVREEIDLVEEVLRFEGLNNIPASLPRLTTGDVRNDEVIRTEEQVRDFLSSAGLSEIVTYSFVGPEQNADFSEESPVPLTNALAIPYSTMRLSLFSGLLQAVAHNRNYGTRSGALFEIGRTYHSDGDSVQEHPTAAVALFGDVASHWGDPKRPYDFFDVKGVCEGVASLLRTRVEFAAKQTGWGRKGKTAAIQVKGEEIGSAGFVSPGVLQRYDIKGDVIVASMSLRAMAVATSDSLGVADVSRFPGIPMVLAFHHDQSVTFDAIASRVRSLEVPYLSEVGMWDRYVAEHNPGSVKTALGLWYQAADRSLTQEEVNEAHARLSAGLAELLPIEIIKQ